MTDQPQTPGGAGNSGAWQPVPGGGDYDPDQTMHVSFAAQLPPEPRPGEDPLGAHGPVGEQDPATSWTIPVIRDEPEGDSGEYSVGAFVSPWDQAPSPAAPTTQSFPAGMFGQGAAAAQAAQAQARAEAEAAAGETAGWAAPPRDPAGNAADTGWSAFGAPAAAPWQPPAEAAWPSAVDEVPDALPGAEGSAEPGYPGDYAAPYTPEEPGPGHAPQEAAGYGREAPAGYAAEDADAYGRGEAAGYPPEEPRPAPDGADGYAPGEAAGFPAGDAGGTPEEAAAGAAAQEAGPDGAGEGGADGREYVAGAAPQPLPEAEAATEQDDGEAGPVPLPPDGAEAVAGAGDGPEPAEEAPEPTRSEHPVASYVLRVNGAERPVTDAWLGESLLYVLRERLGLAGAKDGCEQGECGACSVQVDGRLVASCLVPAATAAGSEVRTVEGLSTDGRPCDIQQALADCGAVQCGFCIPGMAMTMHDLLEGNHRPNDLETRQALSGNLCRCSGYRGVVDAVRQVVATRDGRTVQEADEPPPAARIPAQPGPASPETAV
ncbi:2Fe-2S iron-sulfur cluster-binding protein [Streptomyces sp. NRRL F-5123]|uniref:2Fe-2S iron-sulfur cluster-binding protein n=1 Tax=Streptomyces sp. NRRL F-5123 TaxID=1463856 RepID=UPI0007C5D89C|nr:(2Fe-2S)-binding protein [Streptomyces sp. NRRL F-5123]